MALVSACLSEEERDEAQQIALADPRLTEVLATHPYTVVDVYEPSDRAQAGGADAIVGIEFDEGFPTAEYGLDVCDIGGHDDVVTGIRWLVDVDSDAIQAVSPVWGDVSCSAW